MTEEDLPFEIRPMLENNQEQKKAKKTSKDYSAAQNAKRGYLAVLKPLIIQANEIKKKKGFRNDSETLEYLLDIEKSVRKNNLVQEYNACKVCGEGLNVDLPDNTNITHLKADMQSTCFGCKTTKYRVKTKIEMLPGTIEIRSGTTQQKDHIIEEKSEVKDDNKNISKKRYTQKEVSAMSDDEFDRLALKETEEFMDE